MRAQIRVPNSMYRIFIQISQIKKIPGLENSIKKSIKFLSYFIHPDGSFLANMEVEELKYIILEALHQYLIKPLA